MSGDAWPFGLGEIDGPWKTQMGPLDFDWNFGLVFGESWPSTNKGVFGGSRGKQKKLCGGFMFFSIFTLMFWANIQFDWCFGKWSNLTVFFFQLGWFNHQLENMCLFLVGSICPTQPVKKYYSFKKNLEQCHCCWFWGRFNFLKIPLGIRLFCATRKNVKYSYPWTPKPWNMKVLQPQYMGYKLWPLKIKVVGSLGRVPFVMED